MLPDTIPPEVLQKLDPEERQQLSRVFLKFSSYRSHWPPAELIAEADAIKPGYGELIIQSVSERLAHRSNLEMEQVRRSETRMDRAQWFGFIVALSGIAAATYLGPLVTNAWLMGVVVVLILACIGGPFVARVLADKIYIDLGDKGSRNASPPARPKRPQKN